jgi:branched-chain amino acid aminotransferase
MRLLMKDNSGKYIVLDGMVKDASEAVNVDTVSGRTAYEVLRVIRGVPLFFEDHFERLIGTINAICLSSAIKSDRSEVNDNIITEGQLKENIKKLLAANEADMCNVKIVISDIGARARHLIYISKSHYPTHEEVVAGVKTGLLQIERHNPNAKVLNQTYIDAVSAKMKEDAYYELILVDSRGQITEGSKSNAFFVRDGSVYTAPGEFVLKGITRKYVFEACKKAGYQVIEQFVNANELPGVEAAFLSGTSIKVFPISTVEQFELNSSFNPVIAAIRREYDELLEKYIENNGKSW